MREKKRIALLGATGSIGSQTLDIIRENPSLFEVVLLTANNQVDALISLALEFTPKQVIIANDKLYSSLKENLSNTNISVASGEKAIIEAVQREDIDIILSSLVGYSGVLPTLAAVRSGKTIALANKEALVVAGEIIMSEAKKYKSSIYPVDSEHSAIYQCLMGEKKEDIDKLILTASGGPFLNFTKEQLKNVTPQQALKHPNWSMGAKVSIDSSTLMNKGFELIEARWLFDIPTNKINVLIHPQSIIHSMVEFCDGSIKAQLGQADMRLPISLAIGLGKRIPNQYPRLDFSLYNFSFSQPNTDLFPNLSLAYNAIEKGGNMPCILNAANEVVVMAFLQEKISFCKMSEVIDKAIQEAAFIPNPSIEDLIKTNSIVREITLSKL